MVSVKRCWRIFQNHVSPAAMATMLAAVICAVILFVPPINGYADNGDFYRAMLSNGVYRLPTKSSQYIGYVVTKFGILKYFNENAPSYQIVCAGSLLGAALHQGTSFPVGKVEFLDLYPLSFAEFLYAMDQNHWQISLKT